MCIFTKKYFLCNDNVIQDVSVSVTTIITLAGPLHFYEEL